LLLLGLVEKNEHPSQLRRAGNVEFAFLKQLQKFLGRKAGLVEDAFERAAFEVFAVKRDSNNSGAGRVTEKLM
jgi:hypothetical protein